MNDFIESDYNPDLESTKCAEIFRQPEGTLTYVCLYCSKQMLQALDFELHLLGHFAKFELKVVDNKSNGNELLEIVFLEPNKMDYSDEELVKSKAKQPKENIKISFNEDDDTDEGNGADDEVVNEIVDEVDDKVFNKVDEKIENKNNNDSFNEDDNNDDEDDDDDDDEEENEEGEEDNNEEDNDDNFGIDCIFCKQIFQCSGLREQHSYTKHATPKPPYNCNICNARFNSKKTSRRHKKLHKTLNLPKCNHCKRVFEFQSQLDRHLSERSVNPKKQLFRIPKKLLPNPHKCGICKHTFHQISQLNRHQLKRHGPDGARNYHYNCDLCKFGTNTRGQIIIHMRVHTKERPFSCDICGKTFAQSAYIRLHRLIHTGEKSYQCNECGIPFYSIGLLNNHIKLKHSVVPLKMHPCSECERQFSVRHLLKNHLRTHTGEKPYACEICGASFTSKKLLSQHKLIHSETKRYKCRYDCDMSFAQTAGRRCHERRRHENI